MLKLVQYAWLLTILMLLVSVKSILFKFHYLFYRKGLADIEINISCDKLNGGGKIELKEIYRSRTFEQGSESEIQQLT
jgi:hypothetical protein